MDHTSRILGLINGYKISNALFIAAELKLFDYIDGKRTVHDIAMNLSINSKALEIVLDLFVSVELIRKKCDGIYFIDEEALPLLVSDSKNCFIPLIELEDYLSEKHTNKTTLRNTIISGKGFDCFNQNSKENHEEIYGKAMDHGSQYSSVCVARELMNINNGKVLDVGGGIGTYSIQLCKMNRKIEVDIFDKEEMERECLKNISQNDLCDRIRFYSGDIRDFNFNTEYEGVILSNILHLFNEDTNKKIIKKMYQVLKDDGIIVFNDFFLSDDKTSSLIPSLFTLDWLMHGSFFNASVKDLSDWAEEMGLKTIKVRQYKDIPTTIIVVQKIKQSI